METFIEVNKLLGENVTKITKRQSCDMKHRPHDWNYQVVRKIFCKNLANKGYALTMDGNYINATNKNGETVTFFFAAHNPNNKNYCLPTVLKNKVNYFAFYNNKTDVVYIVGYGIVREYCKTIRDAYIFYGDCNKPKMFIPDSWAQKQKINTLMLY